MVVPGRLPPERMIPEIADMQVAAREMVEPLAGPYTMVALPRK